VAYVVGPRNLRQRFARFPPRQSFSLLMLSEGRLAAELHAPHPALIAITEIFPNIMPSSFAVNLQMKTRT
jgi:hypothetical protein